MQKFLTSSLRFRFFVMAITRGRCPSSHRATVHRFRGKAVNAFSRRKSLCRSPS
jgi:hypothetical protein